MPISKPFKYKLLNSKKNYKRLTYVFSQKTGNQCHSYMGSGLNLIGGFFHPQIWFKSPQVYEVSSLAALQNHLLESLRSLLNAREQP